MGKKTREGTVADPSAARSLPEAERAPGVRETPSMINEGRATDHTWDLVLNSALVAAGASEAVLLTRAAKTGEFAVSSSAPPNGDAVDQLIEVAHSLCMHLGGLADGQLIDDRSLRNDAESFLRSQKQVGEPLSALPLSWQGRLVGIAVMRGATLTESKAAGIERLLLEQAGASLGLATEFAASREKVRELSALAALTTTPLLVDDFERLVGSVVKRVKELVGAERVVIMLYDPTSKALVAQLPAIGFTDHEVRDYRLPIAGGGIAVGVFESGQPYWSNDPMSDPVGIKYWMNLHKPRTVVCVPLEVDGSRIGLVYASNKINGKLTDADVELVAVLASYLGVLLENARLFDIEHRGFLEARELNALVKRQEEELRRTLQIHDEFTQAVLAGQGVLDTVRTLYGILPNQIRVEDRFSNALAYYPTDEDPVPGFGRICSAANEGDRPNPLVRSTIDAVTHSRKPRRVPPIPELGLEKPCVVAPLRVGNETLGFITVTESHRELDALDVMAVQQAATAISLQLMKEQAAAQAQYKRLGEFVFELLAGEYDSRPVVLNRGAYLGVNLNVSRCVLVVGLESNRSGRATRRSEEETAALGARVAAVAEQACSRLAPGSVVVGRGEEIVVLANLTDTSKHEGGTRPQELGEAILRDAKAWLPRTHLSIGIGSTCDELEQYQISYQQARNALSVIRASGGSDRALSFDQLGLLGLVLESRNHKAILALAENKVGKLRDYDASNASDLLTTLETYLAFDGRQGPTASSLHVHPNTLRYRLRRIEQVSGADLDSPDEKLNLRLALRVLRLFADK